MKRILIAGLCALLLGCVSEKKQQANGKGWVLVQFGMTRSQVHQLVGKEPLSGADPHQEVWMEGSDSAPWKFVVTYDDNDKVVDYRSVFSRY